VETPRLRALVKEGKYPLQVFAVYVGASAEAWAAYRDTFPGVTHVWDPEITSDWQRLYGVLQTPRMFLVNPSGTIVGRNLDTPALRILLNKEFSSDSYVYGEPSVMLRYAQFFTPYGDSLKVSHVMDVADYLAARTFGEGNIEAFKQVEGDFLYFLSSQKTEVFRDAAVPFVEKYITKLPDVWTTPADKAQIVSLGEMLADLSARTPAGSRIPNLTVPGVLRRKPPQPVAEGAARHCQIVRREERSGNKQKQNGDKPLHCRDPRYPISARMRLFFIQFGTTFTQSSRRTRTPKMSESSGSALMRTALIRLPPGPITMPFTRKR
jgi:hypothetical protein